MKKILKFPFKLIRKIKHFLFPTHPLGIVFMLHRVDEWEEGKLFSNENMKVTPNTLEKQLVKIKETHTIIPITEIKNYLTTKHKKPFAVFTMDDGYKDNYVKALPIFEKAHIPFTIFLTTDFPDKKAILWWYVLEDLVLNNREIILSNGKYFSCITLADKEKAFLDIRLEILALNQENLHSELNALFSPYNIDWFAKNDELCLSWNEVEILNKHPLVTIGGHTKHHYNLKSLQTQEQVKDEIQAGLVILAGHNIKTSVFAYPFGSPNEVSEREINIVDNMDFTTAFIAGGGITTKQNSKNFFALPRVMLTENYNQ